jgi:hypothetical protein
MLVGGRTAMVVLVHFHLVGSEDVLAQLGDRNDNPKNLISRVIVSLN